MTVRKKGGAASRHKRAEALRRHSERAIAELVWCERHIAQLRKAGTIQKTADIRPFCGKHWLRMWKEWRAVARLCRNLSRTQDRDGHPIVAALLGGAADKLTQPNDRPLRAIDEAKQLLAWIPFEPTPAEESHYWWLQTVIRMPVLDPSTKLGLIKDVFSRPGRPSDTRGIAAYALEMHLRGESWPQIEMKLLPQRRNAPNLGEIARRQTQLLKALLRRQGICK